MLSSRRLVGEHEYTLGEFLPSTRTVLGEVGPPPVECSILCLGPRAWGQLGESIPGDPGGSDIRR